MEEWRDIPGYVGFYQASNEGAVRSVIRLTQAAIDAGERQQKTRLKPGYNLQGRLQVVLCVGGKTRRYQLHRLVYTAFHGPVPDELLVLHRDGNHLNNRPDNLYLGTQLQNMADKAAHGRQLCGVLMPNAKLTEDDVRRIRTSNERPSVLAREIGVTLPCILNTKSRKAWKHVP